MTPLPRYLAAGCALWLGVATAAAQPADDIQNVAAAPIECWTRTSARSVRVGEVFSLVLTCAVLETQSTTVVPDQSRLDPSVLQVPPFEVVGGVQARDVRTPTRRFFQYEYSVRFLGETIGADVALPGPTISYRVQSRVQADAAVEGRDREYILPNQIMRIVSLVPATANDIRDEPPETFREVEARRFRSEVFGVVRLVLLGLAGITLIWAVMALFKRPRKAVAARLLASDGAVLKAAARELAQLGRERRSGGWTPERVAEALSALRIAAAYALGRTAAQTPAPQGAAIGQGQLLVGAGWHGQRRVAASAAATAEAVANARRTGPPTLVGDAALDDLQRALERFGAAVYGRESSTLDDAALDDALEQAVRGTRAVAAEHTWVATRVRSLRTAASGLVHKAWAR